MKGYGGLRDGIINERLIWRMEEVGLGVRNGSFEAACFARPSTCIICARSPLT